MDRRRFIYMYCVPLMEKRRWLVDLYLLCVHPNGKEEWLVDYIYVLCVHNVCP